MFMYLKDIIRGGDILKYMLPIITFLLGWLTFYLSGIPSLAIFIAMLPNTFFIGLIVDKLELLDNNKGKKNGQNEEKLKE